jgi:hypothetical protein
MRYFQSTLPAIAILTLAACGGGGGGGVANGIPTPVMNESVGGIWTTQYTVNSGANAGDVIQAEGIVSETGQFFAFSKNTTNGCAGIALGSLSVNGANVSGTENATIVRYSTISGVNTSCIYADGTTSATGTITGQIASRASLTLTATGMTSQGNALPSETTTFSFSNLYLNSSSFAAIAGNYNDLGATMTVDANGAIFEQDTNGCVLSGQVSIINASYNAYSVQLTFANCTGSEIALNGVTASGLVTLDNQVSPIAVVGGITATVNGQAVAEIFELPRM